MRESNGYHHGDLKTTLILEGRAMIAESGYDGFSMRKLARRTGVTPMALYRHFPSRKDFLVAVVDDAFERFAHALEASVPNEAFPEEQLRRLMIGYVRFFVMNPDILTILFLEASGRDATVLSKRSVPSPAALAESYGRERSFRVFHDLALRIAPRYASLSEREVVLAIWSRAHGVAVLLSQERWLFDAASMDDASLGRVLCAAL